MKKLRLPVLLTGALCLTAQLSVARELSCVVDRGAEAYPVAAAYSTAAALQVGPTVARLALEDTVETRHCLSAFSNLWDIRTMSTGFQFFIR